MIILCNNTFKKIEKIRIPLKKSWGLVDEVEIVLAANESIPMMNGALEAPTSLPAHLKIF